MKEVGFNSTIKYESVHALHLFSFALPLKYENLMSMEVWPSINYKMTKEVQFQSYTIGAMFQGRWQ